MSQPDPEAFNWGDEISSKEGAATGYGWSGSYNYRDPRPAWQTSQVDGSGHLFSMYVDVASEKDTEMAKSWKGDADGILVFTGVFSAAVATFTTVSLQDLRRSPQDTSNFYLANIYRLLAAANGSQVAIPPTLLDPLAPFSPPSDAIWVNSLWSLSLTISLTCTLLATMLQQWARRYVRITQPRYSPEKRARIRAFFSEGVDKLHLPWAVEALPVLLHLSLFLFFAGLLVYLRGIHYTVFSAVASWIGLCVAMYTCITFMPIFRHDSPYYAPLSTSAWYLVSGLLFLFFRTLLCLSSLNLSFRDRFDTLTFHYGRSFLHGPEKIAEETARKTSSEIDGHMLTWTLDSLYQDFELEQFFSGIPSFCISPLLVDPLGTFIRPNKEKLLWALIGWMDRTSTSHLVPNEIKQRRTAIFMDAMDAASLPLNEQILDHIFSEEWRGLLNSVDLGLFLRRRVDPNNPDATSYTHCAISIIISRERERDNRWFELTTRHLGISGPVLRNYLAHGDSVLLANCIYITRYLIEIYSRECWLHTPGSRSKTFESVTQFDIQRTLPGLQHDFCHLWNEIVHKAQNPGAFHIPSICVLALRHLRDAYISLHQDTGAAPTAFSAYTDIDDPILDEPSSYPLCDIDSHRHSPQVDSTPGIANITATATEDTATSLPFVSTANLVIATDPSTSAPPMSSPYAPNPSATFSGSMPRDRRPAIPIIAPSFTVSPESYLCDTPTDSAPPANGAIAGAVEGEGAPSFSTPAFSGVTPTNPPPDSPTPTHPSTSARVSSVVAPPTASISDPQVASSIAAFNAREDAHDLNTPAEPPDKASLPPPDKVTGLAPPS